MRNFLTFVAVALVTALTVALVAPPFIDWSAQREMVARAIAGRIGAPVAISGHITLRLLPTPFLDIADVRIGPRNAPWLTGRAMRFEFSFASLMGGRIRLDDVTFDHAALSLGPRFAPPGEGRLDFEHIRASHAEIRIQRADATPILLHDVNFDGSARSTRGPWRGAGDFALAGERARFQLASGDFEGDVLPLKAEVGEGDIRVAVDGRLALVPSPSFAGTAAISGEIAAPQGGVWPWRIAGTVAASGEEARMPDAEARLGDEARALAADGRVSLRLGPRPSLDADLKGKTLNIDALLRRDKQTFAPPARAADIFAALAQRMLRNDAPLAQFSLRLQGRSAYLGARLLDAPSLAVAGAPDSPVQIKLESGLPGRGRIALDGALELRPAPIFRGRGQGDAGDFAALAAWLAEDRPALASRLSALGAALPQGDLSAAGNLELSPEGYAVRDLALGVGPSHFDGSVVYRQSSADSRGRLYLDLSSDALDIATAPNIEAGLNWLGDTDLDFRLKADALRVGRVGLASVSGGSLALRAKKDGPKFTLEKLSLADLGGASIQAEGEASPAGRWARVKLDAGRLSDFAALLARVAPGAPTRWLQRRADELGAAKATFEARRDGPPLEGPFALDFLKADGEIAGARFSATLSRAPAPVDAISAEATLDSLDAGGLLRKLGLAIPPGPPGRGQLTLTATGQWDRGFEAKAKLAFAGSDLSWSGAFRPQAESGAVTGPLTLKSGDVFPALAALGLAPAGAGARAPADLAANLEAGAEWARFAQLKGTLAGSRVSGELAWARSAQFADDGLIAVSQSPADAAPVAVSGALEFDRASLGALLQTVLGRPQPRRAGASWSEAKFGPPLLSPPRIDVGLKVDALDVGAGVGRSAAARLRMNRDRLALSDVSMWLNGGKASGRLDLTRGPSQATASGALALAGVEVEPSGAKTRIDGHIDFVGSGDSEAALIGSLAGAGALKVVEARIARLDPKALSRAYQKVQQAAGAPPEEKKLEALVGAELDKGSLSLAGAEGAAALTGGALRFGPLQVNDLGVSVSGAFNLSELSLSLETTETDAGKLSRFWSGPPPVVVVAQKGALDGSGRKIDVSLLAAGLSSEAIARESDRIENFEADVRERAMFNRERKAWAFLDRRSAEISAYLDDQQRRRLMEHYLGPYTQWAESHREAPVAKNAAGL